VTDIIKNEPLTDSISSGKSNTLVVWGCAAIIAVITFFVLSPSLKNGFVNWDDFDYVTANSMVMNKTVPLIKILKTPVSGNYHPITILSLALNYQFGDLDPVWYHAVNLIFHVLNTILVFFFVFLLTRRNLLMACIVSLFFGIHPMHVESVAWVSERKDVLYLFFFMAGLITYLYYRQSKKIIWYFFTLVLFILSCLSKAMAVVFPVILLLIDYLRGVKWERKLLLEKIPFFALSLLFGIIALKAQASANAMAYAGTVPLAWRLLFACYSVVIYAVRLFVPYKLSAVYSSPVNNAHDPVPPMLLLFPFIVLIIITVLIYCVVKGKKEIVFGVMFYFTTIILVLKLVCVGSSIMSDRYTYLSYIGLLFTVVYAINIVWQSRSRLLLYIKYPIAVVVVLSVFIFSYQSYARTQVWQSSEILWTDVITNYPDVSLAYVNRGRYYQSNHETEKALTDYDEAIQIDPLDSGLNRIETYYNLGLLYSDNKQYDEAIKDFSKTIALDPNFAEAYNNRGWDYFIKGKNDSAIVDYNKAIAINHYNALYYSNRALSYKEVKQYKNAVNDLTMAIQIDSSHIEMFYNWRGICNLKLKNYNGAVVDFSKVIDIDPSFAGYWLNRSVAERKLGQKDNAQLDSIKGWQLQGK